MTAIKVTDDYTREMQNRDEATTANFTHTAPRGTQQESGNDSRYLRLKKNIVKRAILSTRRPVSS